METVLVRNVVTPGTAANTLLDGSVHAAGATTLNLLAAGTGTAANSTTNNAGYAIGATVITLAAAGTGAFTVNDRVTFAGQTTKYRITSGDPDVSNGGSITITPGLVSAIPAANTAITLLAAYTGSGTVVVDDLIQVAGDDTKYRVTAGDASVANGGTLTITPGLKVAVAAANYAAVSVVTKQQVSGPGWLQGINVVAGTTPGITIYDGTSASDPVLYSWSPSALGSSVQFPGNGIPFRTGLHCVVTGTATPKFVIFVG